MTKLKLRSQQELTLQDRRILNLMIEHAGPHIATTRTHRIALRGSHKGGERVRDSINRLMRTIVEVPTRDWKGQPATQRGVFLSDSTTTDDESNPDGEVVYAFSEHAPGHSAVTVLGPAEGIRHLLVPIQICARPL